MSLFEGRSGAHGTHGEPTRDKAKWGIQRTARTLREPVTIELWREHLAGTRPLGVIPVREDSTCSWGSIDVDVYDDPQEHSQLIERASGYPLVPCRSKSGGLHLFLFLTEPQPAAVVQAVLRDTAAGLGVANSEIFPKQSHVLSDRGDLGNWMVMPYFGGDYDGKLKRQAGVRPGQDDMLPEEFVELARSRMVGPDQLATLGATRRQAPRERRTAEASGPADFSDGPVCLQHIAGSGGFNETGRNNSMMMVGIYLKRRHPDDWRQRLEVMNRELCHPPLDADEISAVQKSLAKKDYEYTCKKEPMCSHCDSHLCMTRRYGVGEAGNYPEITSISKVDTKPPMWFIDVSGRRVECTTDELSNYPSFQKRCLDDLNHYFRVMTRDSWARVVNEALEDLTLIEAPPEVGHQGAFVEYLEDFLTNRRRGKRREDLFGGRPYEDAEQGRHYFRLRDLCKHLERENYREEGKVPTRNRVARRIADLGGEAEFINIGGRGVRAWWVPSSVIEAPPDPEAPPVPGATL